MRIEGCYYLHIFYPSNVFLEEKTYYDFKVDDKNFSVFIIAHLKSLMINDFDNKIVKVENENSKYRPQKSSVEVSQKNLCTILNGDDTASYIIDYQNHFYREFYSKKHTELIVSFEANKSDKNIDFALKALSYFINSYRLVANDVLTLSLDKMPYISRIIKEAFHTYSANELAMSETDRLHTNRSLKLGIKQVLFPFWNTEGKTFETDPKRNTSLLKNFFENRKTPDNLSDFILKAREELHIHNNYKYSFIESWTVIEIAINSFLRKLKLEKGISKNKIDTYESEVGISYLLNIELPMVYSGNDPKFKELINKVDLIRKQRNKVIHENRGISLEEATNALNVAVEFLNFMEYKKY